MAVVLRLLFLLLTRAVRRLKLWCCHPQASLILPITSPVKISCVCELVTIFKASGQKKVKKGLVMSARKGFHPYQLNEWLFVPVCWFWWRCVRVYCLFSVWFVAEIVYYDYWLTGSLDDICHATRPLAHYKIVKLSSFTHVFLCHSSLWPGRVFFVCNLLPWWRIAMNYEVSCPELLQHSFF